jgi:hypothetical protein
MSPYTSCMACRIFAGPLFLVWLAQAQPGVPPQSAWSCPITHPIKGNFTTHSGEPCIYHVPGGGFYDKTKPERCYVSEADAVRDRCRRSKSCPESRTQDTQGDLSPPTKAIQDSWMSASIVLLRRVLVAAW